jgi:hypothetical protein
MENSPSMEMQHQINGLLSSWAIKYQVPVECHRKIEPKIKPLLHDLYKTVKRGDNPTWMSDCKTDFNDSFDYALDSAESAYERMVRTSINLEFIRKKILKRN